MKEPKEEPEYYGIARVVKEGATNFGYLDCLDYSGLGYVVNRAAQTRDNCLKRAALIRMSKKYLESVIQWCEEVDKRTPDFDASRYLEQCNELLRYGLNDRHKEVLVKIWPYIKEKADNLVVNLRLLKHFPAKKRYHYYGSAVEVAAGLRERVERI